jgi:hypothetical protein
MNKFKKDFESRMKAEMNAEIVRIREFEISNVRLEEAEKCRNEMQEYILYILYNFLYSKIK